MTSLHAQSYSVVTTNTLLSTAELLPYGAHLATIRLISLFSTKSYYIYPVRVVERSLLLSEEPFAYCMIVVLSL
jgi:hypothetical protein